MTQLPTKVYRDSRASHAHRYLLPAIRRLLAGFPETRQILDAGCGNGSLSHELFRLGYTVTGVDASESGVAMARASFPKITFEVASVYEMASIVGDDFDAVVSVEVIEHLFSPRAFLRQAALCLRPGGRLLLTTPYHGYLKNLVLALTGRLDRHFNALTEGGHIKFWSRRTLTALLQSEGWQVLDFAGAGRLPRLWKSMILVAVWPGPTAEAPP